MGRKLPSEGRWVTVPVRLREATVARLDSERGEVTRSAWLRAVAAAALSDVPEAAPRAMMPLGEAPAAEPARLPKPRPAAARGARHEPGADVPAYTSSLMDALRAKGVV